MAKSPGVSLPRVTPPPEAIPRPPVADRRPREEATLRLHGHLRVDDYSWLRDKGAPDVVAYLRAENAYADAVTRPTEALQSSLYGEMLARLKEDDTTPPYKNGSYFYYQRTEKGKQYPIRCRKSSLEGAETVIMDLNELGKSQKFIALGGMTVSDDDRTLAYLVDTVGFRQFELEVKDLTTGQRGSEAIPRVDSVAFAKDSRTLFYVTEDPQTKRADKLFRHVLGEDVSRDVLVYEEKDAMFELELERSRSRAFAFLTSASRTTSEVRIIDSANPTVPPRLVAAREHGHEYYLDHAGASFFIRTNSGGRNFRLVTAPVGDPRRERWKELIPHRPDVMLEDVFALKDHLVVWERQDALSQLAVVDIQTGSTRRFPQPEPLFEVTPAENFDFEETAFRFRYESLKTPASVVEYDLSTMGARPRADGETPARKVLKQTEVPGYRASAYETRRILARARDGTLVPVSLVYRNGVAPDGTHPLFLAAYGSYGISTPLAFSPERVSLLDRGFVYALAHIRGGGDLGKKWHDQGRMMTKMNTFTDFIDVADFLKSRGWAKRDALVVAGGSAGGLLMGAVANMRPELFRVVLAYVPFVDVVNTMLDETLPLTVNEFEEWGNPRNKPEFDYMMQYSPYDNVARKAYPSMLVRTSYNDSQVMYWEPAKWVAKLRAMKTDGNPLIFKINMDPAGHGGQSGRYDRLHDVAFDFAFVLQQLGVGGSLDARPRKP